MRGTDTILITGRILIKSIPIGADITLVSIMTRIFIMPTIVARGKVGSKDSMASVLPGPLVPGFVALEPLVLAFVNPEPQVLAVLLLEPLVPEFVDLKQPALGFVALEPLVRRFRNLVLLVLPFVLLEPLVPAFVDLKQPALELVNL